MRNGRTCETCGNLIACGEGDHLCGVCKDKTGTHPAMVIEGYSPAEDYMICEGEMYE